MSNHVLFLLRQTLYSSIFFVLFVLCPLSLVHCQENVVQPERAELQKLEQADRLFENGHVKEAAQLLGQLLENCQDGTFYIAGDNADNAPPPQLIPFRHYLIGKLTKLPKEARESYSFQFETLAKRLLDDALQAGSAEAIIDIARKYFPTRAGSEAAFALALLQFESGDNEAALLNIQQLQKYATAHSGSNTLSGKADEILKRIEYRRKNAANVKISEADYLDIAGWRMPEGVSNQNPKTNITPPIPEPCWDVPLVKPHLENEVLSLLQTVQNSPDTYIPAPMPLIAGGKLITRGSDDITAIDLQTGKRLWSVSEPPYQVFPPHWIAPIVPPRYSQRNTLRFNLWHNRITQHLSSSGNLLFSIDGHELLLPLQSRSAPAIALGGTLYEDRRYERGSTLTARSIQTGEIVWQTGKFPLVQKYIDACIADADNNSNNNSDKNNGSNNPADKDARNGKNGAANQNNTANKIRTDIEPFYSSEEKQLLNTCFLGVPLPLNGRLYVIGENGSLIQLFVLDTQSGNLIRHIPLSQASKPIETDLLRRTYPLIPSAYGGIMLCPTGSGLTVALDAATLSVLWCYNYVAAPNETPNDRLMHNQIQHLAVPGSRFAEQQYRQIFAESGWQMPSILIDSGCAVIAPPDSASLHCLDLLSGKFLWKKNIGRADALFPACIRNGKIFIVTPEKMTAFDLRTGSESLSIVFPASLRPCGTGIAGGSRYFLPMSGGYLACIHLDDKTQEGNAQDGHTQEDKIDWQSISGQHAGQPFPPPQNYRQRQTGLQDVLSANFPAGEEWISPPVMLSNTTGALSAASVFKSYFGNLAGVQGHFFSQSPLNVMCFAQKEPLAKYAEAVLKTNPNDADALLQYGRVLKDGGKLPEAVTAFRQSLKAKPSAEASDALRCGLLEAVRQDYANWGSSAAELLPLAELPEETAEILYALAAGAFKAGEKDKFRDYVQKALALSAQQPVMIAVSANHSVQLRYAFRCIEQGTDNKEREQSASDKIPYSAPSLWNTGQVNVEEATETDISAAMPGQRENEVVARILRLARNAGQFNPLSQRPVPYLGNAAAAMSSVRFSLDTSASDLYLVCYENNGKMRWRIPLSETNLPPEMYLAYRQYSAPIRFAVQTQFVYVTGSPDVLIFVRGNTLTALKTNGSEPEVLWKKVFTGYLPQRQNSSADSIRFIPFQSPPQLARCFPESSVFVSEDVVCVCDAGTVSGFEPLTGQTLWTRTLPPQNTSAACSVLGDDRHLFLVYSETRRTVAVDPLSGNELAEGLIPTGGIYCYKTNIVFAGLENDSRSISAAEKNTGKDVLPDTYFLSAGNLNDLFDKRKRALLVADTDSTLPLQTFCNNLTSRSLMKMLQNNRYLAALKGKADTLQIFDLETKYNVFKQDVPLAVMQLPAAGTEPENVAAKEGDNRAAVYSGGNSSMDFDVEFSGGCFLVFFTDSTEVGRNNPQQLEENGTKFTRHYGPLNAVAGSGIGSGRIMLFDTEGKACWNKCTEINNWFRLVNIPPDLPVSLFGVSITDTVEAKKEAAGGSTSFSTGLMGIDKQTGEIRFSKLIPQLRIPNQGMLPLQNFRVEADVQKQEILFISPYPLQPRIVKAAFSPSL
ncbi:MAG: hypothetical protein LBT46_13540 [Planctomycetaceae bacterium]|jgi:outer membrane protein assembly factor BamB|nr:hypothetical protein [Planctomycetaceae bacterium]